MTKPTRGPKPRDPGNYGRAYKGNFPHLLDPNDLASEQEVAPVIAVPDKDIDFKMPTSEIHCFFPREQSSDDERAMGFEKLFLARGTSRLPVPDYAIPGRRRQAQSFASGATRLRTYPEWRQCSSKTS